jgi:creatinine amidohydrolase
MISEGVKKHFEMSWTEFEDAVKEYKFAFLPIGAIEQHGPHLPMGTDVIIGEHLCERLARATGGLLLHSLAYTPSFSLRLYPGTVRVTDETFAATLVEIANALYQHGIRTIYAFIAHLGALDASKTAERELLLHSQARLVRLVLPGYKAAIEKYCTSERWHSTYVHAEEFETSAVLAIRPELVDMSKAVREYPVRDPLFGPISIPWNQFCKSGVIGDATVATAEKGRNILEHIFRESLALVEHHQDTL